MRHRSKSILAILGACTLIMSGCSQKSAPAAAGKDTGSAGTEVADEKVVNLFTWADYLAPDTMANFEKQTGIKVRVSYFDNNEILESRMLTGHSGFDVVVPTITFMNRQERSGAYLPLDKTRLPNIANLDPALMADIAVNDPGNTYGVAYTWGTFGLGYNATMVAQALPNVPVDSWRIVLDPAFAAKLAPCGLNVLDDPVGVVRIVLRYLGRDPAAPSAKDLADAEKVLLSIRPYVRNIDTTGEIEALANGDLCITMGYNGDVVQSRRRSREAKNGLKIEFAVPKEGTFLWVDLLSIPKDAAHVANAYQLINYLMDPRVIAHISDSIGFANANLAATPLLDPAIAADTAIYPTAEERKRLFVPSEPTQEQTRAITRLWQKFKTGQ